MASWQRVLTACTLAAFAAAAQAAPTTFGFEDQPYTSVATNNLEIDGLRFSPNCHFDIWNAPYWTSNFMGFDASGCSAGGSTNPNFLGPSAWAAGPGVAPALFVDAGGNLFDVLELTRAVGPWILISSNGGYLESVFQPNGFQHVLSGADWSRVSWLLFYSPGAGMPVGFDDLVVSIPEPSPAALVLLGLGVAAGVRRYRQVARQ